MRAAKGLALFVSFLSCFGSREVPVKTGGRLMCSSLKTTTKKSFPVRRFGHLLVDYFVDGKKNNL